MIGQQDEWYLKGRFRGRDALTAFHGYCTAADIRPSPIRPGPDQPTYLSPVRMEGAASEIRRHTFERMLQSWFRFHELRGTPSK